MQQEWIIEGKPHVRATGEELVALDQMPGAPHVKFACLCGHGWWTSKNLTLTQDGGWNGTRHIFYQGSNAECTCPSSQLVCVVEKV